MSAGENRGCPICESKKQLELPKYSVSNWRIVACNECDFVYLANPASYSELADELAWEKSSQMEDARRRAERPFRDRLSKTTRWRVNLLRREKRNAFLSVFGGGHVLDVGCGSGTILPTPIVPYGVEISNELARIADATMAKRGGHCVNAPAVEGVGAFAAEKFDGVLLRSFLEHETEPKQLLDEVHRVIKKDGKVYVRVPNFASLNRHIMGKKWCGFRYPDHVGYFTSHTLINIANRTGFNVKILNWVNLLFDDNIKAVLTKS